jgi:hypothetical protein
LLLLLLLTLLPPILLLLILLVLWLVGIVLTDRTSSTVPLAVNSFVAAFFSRVAERISCHGGAASSIAGTIPCNSGSGIILCRQDCGRRGPGRCARSRCVRSKPALTRRVLSRRILGGRVAAGFFSPRIVLAGGRGVGGGLACAAAAVVSVVAEPYALRWSLSVGRLSDWRR